MEASSNKFELLANHLTPQFGNIYEYNMADGQEVGFDNQVWTDELRTAVRKYLLHDLPSVVRPQLFHSEEGSSIHIDIDEQVDQLLKLEPWEVAFEVRNAAVAAVPTLRELIGNLDTWPSGEESADAIVWLEAHSTRTEWRAVAEASDNSELRDMAASDQRHAPMPDDLVRVLSPKELLSAWDRAMNQVSAEFTDAEWQLLVAHLPKRRNTARGAGVYRDLSKWELAKMRNSFNGLRYKFLNNVPWCEVPTRYGSSSYFTWWNYRRQGLFSHLRDGLKANENPDAKKLVAWLDEMLADMPEKQIPRPTDGAAA
ncbi:transposase [Nocardia beijingensis]|uniref:transposase n=1 Tax=Nocardia beijingensis TaxID=95162 RepID=UPI00339FC950